MWFHPRTDTVQVFEIVTYCTTIFELKQLLQRKGFDLKKC
jgi:hypothetical protein